MPRSTTIQFTGQFSWGVAGADPAMAGDGSLIPNVAVAIHDEQGDLGALDVVAVFTENGARKLIAALEAQLDASRTALVVPVGARR